VKTLIYDIEILGGNFFSVTFIDYKTNKFIQIYKLNNIEHNVDKLLPIIDNCFLIGYNNKMYDDIILNKVRKEGINTKELYNLSQEIINSQKKGRPLWENNNVLPYMRYGVKSLDLMKILAFDKLKISLKQCAINLRHDWIQDLPFEHDYCPKLSDIPTILKYNKNDVDITKRLLDSIIDSVQLRINYSKEFKVDVLNASRTYIGKKTLDKYYSEHTGLDIEEFSKLRTYRNKIYMSECISNLVKFKTPEMNKMLDYFKSYSVGSVDEGIDYLVLFKGKGYQMGFGGLHSVDRPAIYHSTNDVDIMDADVDSYYPFVMLKHKIKPEHVHEEFYNILETITTKRLLAKKSGDKITTETLKITINSIFGLYNFPNYWLYDPKAALSVTINGQMFLLMMIEELELNGFEVISANTDGVTTIVPINRKEEYYNICKKWQEYCQFSLSFTKYYRYIRRDVNNYVSESEKEIKQKGCFLDKQSLDKGYNTTIIAKAVNNYFLKNIPVEETITTGNNIFDYCLSEKTGNQFVMEYHYIKDDNKFIDTLQKNNRFFISKKGGTLLKRKTDNSLHNVALGWQTTILNKYNENELNYYLSNVDHRYYIAEAKKIIDQIEDKQLTLDIWR
jgi:hypothetical protein